jgi:hypothetical protein
VSAFAFIGGLVNLAGGSLDLNIINPAKPASNAAFSWAFLQGLNAIFGVSSLHRSLLPMIDADEIRPSLYVKIHFGFVVVKRDD